MKKNSFVEGTVIATVAVVITKILGMLYVIPFYKIVGSTGGALYSYAYNIYTIFLGISAAGIPTAISKIVSEYNTLGYQEAKYRTFKIGKKIINYASIIGFLCMFIFAKNIATVIIGKMSGGNTIQDVTYVIRAISFAVLVIPYLSVTKGYFFGHNIMTPTSISNILEQVIRIFVILFGSFLSYKVFSLSLTKSVAISVTGAFFGGLIAYLYLNKKIKTNKKMLGIKEYEKKDDIATKEIIHKIISYSIPFIIISIATNIYNFTDMILIIRGLNMLDFSAASTEFIQSAMTTWSTKICMVVSALTMGMSVNLIPNIVESFVKNDWKEVEKKMNKAYQMILYISIPCAIGICFLSVPVWNVFYGASKYGAIILSIRIISTVFSNLYVITFNTMQALNKYHIVYLCNIIGFGINALLDIPLILAFDKIGLPPYWGATVASIIGYTLAIKIATHNLKKQHKLNFKTTKKTFFKILVPTFVMALVLIIINSILHVNYESVFNCIMVIVINALIGGAIYLYITYKMGIMTNIFGKTYINKILKKLTFNKVSISD